MSRLAQALVLAWLTLLTRGQIQAPCSDGAPLLLDVQILLDSSTSIGAPDHRLAKAFLQDFVRNFDLVGPQGTQFGLATYAGFPVLGFPLNLYNRSGDIADHLGRVEYSRGVTLTAEALKRTARELYTPRFGDRDFAPNVMILLTDGWSQSSIPSAVEDALGRGVDIFVLGIGGYRNFQELLELSSAKQDHIFQLPAAANGTVEAQIQLASTTAELLNRLQDVYSYKVCGRNTLPPLRPFTVSPRETTVRRSLSTNSFAPLPTNGRLTETCPPVNCTGMYPSALRADVVLFLDASYPGMSERDFQRHQRLAMEVSERLEPMGPCSVRVGAVQYSDQDFLELRLGDANSAVDAISTLRNLAFMKGIVWSPRASVDPLQDAFRPSYGGREEAAGVVVVLSNGRAADPVASTLARSRQQGNNVLVLGVRDEQGILDEGALSRFAGNAETNYFEFPTDASRIIQDAILSDLVDRVKAATQSFYCGLEISRTQPFPTTLVTASSILPSTVVAASSMDPAVTPAPTPTTTYPPDTDGCSHADVAFLIDSSSSISYSAHSHVLGFLSDTVEAVGNVSPTDGLQVGLVQYSYSTYIEFYLSAFATQDRLLDRLRNTQYIKGATWTARAIRATLNSVFRASRGDRYDAPNVMVIVTDGWAQDDVTEAVKEAERLGVRILVVGVEPDVDERKLLQLALLDRRHLVHLPASDNATSAADEQRDKSVQRLANAIRRSVNPSCSNAAIDKDIKEEPYFPRPVPVTDGGATPKARANVTSRPIGLPTEALPQTKATEATPPPPTDAARSSDRSPLSLPMTTTPGSPTDASTPPAPSALPPLPTFGREELGTSTTQAYLSTPSPRGVPEEYRVDCHADGFSLTIPTKQPFTGWMYVRGRFEEDKCAADHELVAQNKASITIRMGTCGVDRTRSTEPAGMELASTVVMMGDRVFLKEGDRAFHVRCFYAAELELERTVTQSLSFPDMIPVETLDVQAQMPSCQYSLRRDSRNGPSVRFAEVGTKIFHRWDCESATPDMYSILVHSCTVQSVDGQQRVQIIDADGCVADGAIMDQVAYGESVLSAHASTRAFGFADARKMEFQCHIRFCVPLDGGCEGITPPACSRFRSQGRRRRRQAKGEKPERSVVTTLTVLEFFDDVSGATAAQTQVLGAAYRPNDVCVSQLSAGAALGVGILAAVIWLATAAFLFRRPKRF